jgi:hypothetical protein
MATSRTDLINQIKEQRKQAKAQLLYNAGITKLKKSQLKEIAQQLKEINKAMRKEKEEVVKEDLKLDANDLEEEKEILLEELEELKEQDKQTKIEIKELDFDDEEDQEDMERVEALYKEQNPDEYDNDDDNLVFEINDNEIDYNNDIFEEEEEPNVKMVVKKEKEPKEIRKMTRQDLKKRVEFDEFESDIEDEEPQEEMTQQYGGLQLQEAKAQVEDITSGFKDMMMDRIKELRRFKRMKLLTPKFINETIDYHNYYRGEAEKQIQNVLEQLFDGDFDKSFYSKVNKVFDTILNKMEKELD